VVLYVLVDPLSPRGIECCDVAARETGFVAGLLAGHAVTKTYRPKKPRTAKASFAGR
jgi:hypothetical protein